MSNRNKISARKPTAITEETIVWKSTENPTTEGNVIRFPSHQEATYQEISIGEEPVKLKIISSGFSNGKKFSSAPIQLAA